MIKLLRALRQYKILMIVVLFWPVLPMFFINKTKFEITPPSPFTDFNVVISVPQRNAKEISLKVAQIAEKNFNGLPSLISLRSTSEDEKSKIELKFDSKIDTNSAYLFIQEKLDKIKLELPNDVEKIEVINQNELVQSMPADLEVEYFDQNQLAKIKNLIKPYILEIKSINPNIFETQKIIIKLDNGQITKLKMSLPNILSALKAHGFKASIGIENQIFFGIGDSLKRIEELGGIIVGSIGHRPIRLSDISQIEVSKIESNNNKIQLHLTQASSLKKIKQILHTNSASLNLTIIEPKNQLMYNVLIKFFAILFLTIIAQFILQKYFFGIESRFYITLVFNILIICHYCFWKIQLGELNFFDIDILGLTLAIGNILWFIVLSRIRYYFLPSFQIKKIPRSLEQSTLMTMAEIIPTYVIFYIVLILLSLPLLLNYVNTPSSYILKNLLFIGLPVTLFLVIVLPIFEESKWIRNSKTNRSWFVNWSLQLKHIQRAYRLSLILIPLLPVVYVFLPWSLHKNTGNALITEYRGYQENLEYLLRNKKDVAETPIVLGYKPKTYQNMQFTTLGLKLLPDLNLQPFIFAVKELQKQSQVGYFESNNQLIPIVADLDFTKIQISDLFISSQSNEQKPVAIKNLTQLTYNVENAQIYREKMDQQYLLLESNNNLKTHTSSLVPTLWTDYLLKEFHNFYYDHLVYLTFIFLVLAIYLNSFIRAFLMVGFLLLPMSLILATRFLIPIPFHIDSLWLIPICTSIIFLIFLVQTRILDIERTRGVDRSIAVEDLKAQLLLPWSFALVPLVVSLIFKYLFSWSHFWQEGIFIFVQIGLCIFLINKYLFPIFYLEAEEFIEKKFFNYYLSFKKFRQKVG